MDALALITPGEMTAPYPDTPFLPDILTGRLAYLDAATLTGSADSAKLWPVADGLAAYGFASESQNSDTGKRPTLKLTSGRHGGKALQFTAANSQRLVNDAAGAIDLSMPCTLALRLKMSGVVTGAVQNLITGASTSAYLALQVGASGNFAMATPPSSGGESLSGGEAGTDWKTVIAVFNGANSRLHVEGAATATGALGTVSPSAAKLTQIKLGGNAAGLAAFPDMLIDRAGWFGRALTVTDCEGLIADWA